MYWKRRLPHWVPDNAAVFVNWRLAGTLPSFLRRGELSAGAKFVLEDRELDRTEVGPRWLNDPRIADRCVEAILYGEEKKLYRVAAFSVMPNHVHLLIEPKRKLHEIMSWLKKTTAVRANRLLNRSGCEFWQREYYDHWVRTPEEFEHIIRYIEKNPMHAGLAASVEQWRWSSAWYAARK